ncbi:MAG: glycosyltransferase [Pseudomonadales bacterium]|nr:glycosyltransferase [Pseudomonadales bacterium]
MNIQSSLQTKSNGCPSVSIVIVNWRTIKQTQLCLRSIRKFTRYPNFECIVIDNDSRDDSANYLQSLAWIKYIENTHSNPDHRNGLDLGISHSSSDLILIMHTDTFVRNHFWLEHLIEKMGDDTFVVGSQDRVIRPIPWFLFFDDYYRRGKLEKR